MKKIHESRDQFTLDVMRYYREVRGDQRYGQAFFNYLETVYPEAADVIRGTPCDPFYRNYVDMETWLKVYELVGL